MGATIWLFLNNLDFFNNLLGEELPIVYEPAKPPIMAALPFQGEWLLKCREKMGQ